MAELELGQHCGVEHCRQLDFLPFVCDGCSGVFCLEHRSRTAHDCSETWCRWNDFEQFAVISSVVLWLMEYIHLLRNIYKVVQQLTSSMSLVNLKTEEVKPDNHKFFLCTYKSCDGKELVPVLCPYCEKHFCLRHRHQVDHECEKLEMPKPRMAVTQQLVKDIVDSKKEAMVNKRCRGAKNSETAAKVALMKLKMHACGDKSLPQAERIYFQVFLPKGSKEKSKPMFFCSKWSIGKVIDCAASLANLKNDNNKTTAKKLRLCHTVSGEALPLEHTIASWIGTKEFSLCNGGSVVLEYLDDDLQFLEDVHTYLE